MSRFKFLSLVLAVVLLASCSDNKPAVVLPGISSSTTDSASYAVGVSFAQMIKQSNLEALNLSEVTRGMVDACAGKENLKIKEEEIGPVIQSYMLKAEAALMQLKQEEQAAFFAENAGKDSVQTTESGLQYKIVKPGNDSIKATLADTVEVHYTGSLLDGTVFDSSYSRGPEPAKFPLRGVIKGWSEGLQLVGEGGKITLWIPYELGYGPRALGPNLPAFSTLVFEVELLKVYKEVPKNDVK